MAHFLEKLYPYVPVSAQNLGISLYGLAYRQERLGGRFNDYVKGFHEREVWSEDRMSAYLDQELRRILLRAFDQTGYFPRRWAACGLTRPDLERFRVADLPKLPLLPKADLRSRPEQLIARDVPTNKVHRYVSSGTTGTPVTSFCTSEDHRRFFAAREARSFNWAKVSILQPRAMIGGRMIIPHASARPPYYRYNFAERQVYFTAYHIGPQTVWNYVEGLNRYRPGILTGYAYSHFLLARLMLEQDLQLAYQPQAIIVGSEKLTPEMRTVVEQAFHAPVYEEYGAVEQCFLVTQCENGSLHVSSDFGIIEIVDDQGSPVSPGIEGRIVATGLLNETQPLIRYDLGDIGTFSPRRCDCGRSLPVLIDLVGRLEDVVISPDGREMVRLDKVFLGMAHVIEAQVIQEEIKLIRVRLVADKFFDDDDEALIRTRLATERLGDVQVVIEKVDVLERTERGKFRAVISKISAEQRSALKTQLRTSSTSSSS